MLYLLLISFICLSSAFRLPGSSFITRTVSRSTALRSDRLTFLDSSFLLLEQDPKYDDMKVYSLILANVTDHLENPHEAKKIVDRHTSWLINHNIPQLTQQLLDTIPSVRKDRIMCLAYDFILGCMINFTQGSVRVFEECEKLVEEVHKASMVSAQDLDKAIADNFDKLSGIVFMKYLEGEIAKCNSDSPRKELLTLVKLRILEEQGKRLSVEDKIIAELCILDNSDERRMLARQYLDGLSEANKKTLYGRVVDFLQEMERGSAGNVSVYSNAKDLEGILRMLIFSSQSSH